MIENLIKWWWHRSALSLLKRRYLRETAIDSVLKDWVTDCIISRKQEGRRKELVTLQNKVKEEELFYQWLKEQK